MSVTIFTQVNDDPTLNLKPEFVFKGKDARRTNIASDDMQYQRALKDFTTSNVCLKLLQIFQIVFTCSQQRITLFLH